VENIHKSIKNKTRRDYLAKGIGRRKANSKRKMQITWFGEGGKAKKSAIRLTLTHVDQ